MAETQPATDTPGIARELTAFQRTVLTVLAEKPRYGLAVKRELETYYGTEVNHGRLYPNLDELVELGLVEKSELDKRTNEYALTEEGYRALLDQLSWTFDRLVTDDERAAALRERIENARSG